MKIFKYGLPFAALALLASCANDNIDTPKGGDNNQVEATGDAMYVTFNLAMAKTPGTKAGETYDEGDAKEYDINNVVLYLYKAGKDKGVSDESFEFHKRYQLGLGDLTNDNTNQNGITEKQEVTFQIDDLTKDQIDGLDFYAFIIVNEGEFNGPNGLFDTWSGAVVGTPVSTRAQKSVVLPTSGSVTASVNPMIPVIGGKSYFTMTNAPVLDKNNNVVSLYKLDSEKFATSPEAASESAATVYVQRGVAKVTVKGKETSNEELASAVPVYPSEQSANAGSDKVTFSGWALDVINKTTYPVQNVLTASTAYTTAQDATTKDLWSATYFKGSALAGTGVGGVDPLYRIFWAKDPNYANNDATAESFLAFTETTPNDWNSFGTGDWEYCLENTMDFDAMRKSASTRVVFKGSYAVGGETAKSFIVYPGTDLAYVIPDGVTITDLSTISSKANEKGQYMIKDLISDNSALETAMKALKMGTNEGYVYYYPDGVTYYTAIIRHFNDSQTPLTADGQAATSDNKLIVDELNQYKAFQLGRYGVLRNNSYVINVSKVIGYGLPTIPTPGDGPDDEPDPEKYNVILDIQVLDWAVRDNDYNLK